MIILLFKRKKFWTLLLLIGIISIGSSFYAIKDVASSENREYWSNSNDVVWEVHTSDNVIALTFDDGPDPVYTPQVLEILRKNGVRGTFFAVGQQMEKYPELTKLIVQRGNEIANHTYSHPSLRRIGKTKLKDELVKTRQIIQTITSSDPTLFRPPEGYYNKAIVNIARENGYKVILWSWTQDTRDWSNPGVERIINKVLDNAKHGDIVIMHDCGGNRSQTIQALQPIIDGLKKKGLDMITVSELLKKADNSNIVNAQ